MIFKNTIKSIAVFAAMLCIPQISFAHFGSKGPLGGTATTFCVIKKNNSQTDSLIFAGTANGGIYQSANGTSWSAKPVGLKSGKITAITHTGKYLFAATADSGIFRFTGLIGADRYWKKVNTGLTNLDVTALVAIDSITVLAGTNGGGVFKSTNKGASWIAVNNAHLHHLEIAGFAKKGNRVYVIDKGIWGTDDLGNSWFDANAIETKHVNGTKAVSYNATSNEMLLLNEDGLFKATVNADALLNFTLVDTGLPLGYQINSIANDGNNWYLATNQGIFVSASDNISWTAANAGLSTLVVNAVAKFNTTLIAGTSKTGIFTSTIPVYSWTLSNTGFNNITTYSLATNDSIAIVANEYGIFVSKDIISSTIKPYLKSNKGLLDSLNVTDIIFAGAGILATTKNEGVFYSPDTCKSWIQINTGLLNSHLTKAYYSNGKKYVICSNGNVYESDLHSSSWTIIAYDLPIGTQTSALTFFSDKVLLTSQNKGVFVKTVSGTNWLAVNTGLTNLNITSATTQYNKLFIGTHGSAVFVSDTNAINWEATAKPAGTHTTAVDNHYDVDYIQSMLSNEGYVFAAYRGGIYATSDNGLTWVPGGNQFNFPTFSSINKIGIAKGRVFVTTENNSVYSNGLSELPAITGIGKDMDSNYGFAIYPNPSNGNVTIALGNETANVAVLSLNGNTDKTLNNATGNQSISLNVPRGIYIIQIKTANKVHTSKISIQ